MVMLDHECGSRGSSEKLCSGPGGTYGADKDCISETGRSQTIPDMLGEEAGIHQFIIHAGVRGYT